MCTHIERLTRAHMHTTRIETYLYISQSCGSFASTEVLLSESPYLSNVALQMNFRGSAHRVSDSLDICHLRRRGYVFHQCLFVSRIT